MLKRTLLSFLVALPVLCTSQIFEGDEYEYYSEWIWGINKNTNGGTIGGLVLRHSRSIGNDMFATFGVELSNVKHPSEARYPGANGIKFNYGKSNYLYAIRLQYGRDRLLFKKANQQGVQVNAGVSAGPTIGFEVPYYVLTLAGNYEVFDPVLHSDWISIAGPGKLFQGMSEAKIVPGLNAKSSISFEFGTFRSNVTGVELGIMAEAYTREIVLVETRPNKSLYTSFFFTLFWGSRR